LDWLVAIDDTDAGESIGTGAFSRELAIRLTRLLPVRCTGITRHQFLVHPDIPYTTHNSASCLGIVGDVDREDLSGVATDLILFLEHPGADPGLCVARPDEVRGAVADFGRRAQQEVLTKVEAVALGRTAGVHLTELGGDGMGVVGALSATGLRASGEDGRFISLRGIRELEGVQTVSTIVDRTGIDAVLEGGVEPLAGDVEIDTRGWLRPDLRGGRVVLTVRREDGRLVPARKSQGHDSI